MKIFCIGRNYADHAKEMNSPVPSQPLVFMKPVTALLKAGKPFYYPEFSKNIHYELEVVLKICKNGKHVEEKFAHTYYDQVAIGIDFTARDVQAKCKEKGHPWEIAKAFNHSALVGDFQPKENLPDLNSIKFELLHNGESVQKGDTTDLIFPFSRLISHLSKYFTLNVGDYIFTGTPAGVGAVQIGDTIEGFLEGKSMFSCEIK